MNVPIPLLRVLILTLLALAPPGYSAPSPPIPITKSGKDMLSLLDKITDQVGKLECLCQTISAVWNWTDNQYRHWNAVERQNNPLRYLVHLEKLLTEREKQLATAQRVLRAAWSRALSRSDQAAATALGERYRAVQDAHARVVATKVQIPHWVAQIQTYGLVGMKQALEHGAMTLENSSDLTEP